MIKPLKDLHKIFWGTTKKRESKDLINLIFISIQLSELHGTGREIATHNKETSNYETVSYRALILRAKLQSEYKNTNKKLERFLNLSLQVNLPNLGYVWYDRGMEIS